MTAQSLPAPRFLRKTTLQPNERNTNFLMLDNDIVETVSSAEADKVTPLMSKIYLRLKSAPANFWERPGVLHFEGETTADKRVKAWDQLCKHLRVSSETANKALRWMHEQGIIGYSAFKNGVGIRIFLNRATSSIGSKASSGSKKILAFMPASEDKHAASVSEATFNDPFGVSEVLDTDLESRAPKNGADTQMVLKISSEPNPPRYTQSDQSNESQRREPEVAAQGTNTVSVEEIVARLKNELEPCVKSAAASAATQTAAREMERTRTWFETKALPKAVRVAQRETFEMLRKEGGIDVRSRRACAGLEVGRTAEAEMQHTARPLTPEDVREMAETCVALLEAQGKSIELTLSENSAEGGGWLLPQDAPRVREAAQALLLMRDSITE